MRERSIDRLFRRYRDHRDARALAELFDRVAPELARIATHFSKTSDEVEDAVQTAFLTAIERPEMVDPERPFLPWMIGVVTNRCRDLARKRMRTPEADRLRSPEAVDPANYAEVEEFHEAVERSVETLAPKYRSAVHAHLAEGLAPREIAAREGITPNAASVRLHRGLRALRKALPAGFALGAAALVGTPALGEVRARVMEADTGSKAAVAVGASKGGLFLTLAVLGGAVSLAAFVMLSSSNEQPLTPQRDVLASAVEESMLESTPAESQPIVAPVEEAKRQVAVTQATPVPVASQQAAHWIVRNATNGEPVAGAALRAGAVGSAGDLLGRTRDDGTLEANVSLREVERVDAEGFVSWRRSHLGEGEQEGGRGYSHAEPTGGEVMEILLEPGTARRGVVLDDETKEPIEGALVYAFRTRRKMPKPVFERPIGVTDHQGKFVVDGGVPLTNEAGGNVMLYAVAPAKRDEGERTGSASFPVLEPVEGPEVEILCRPSLRAKVTVLDESGQPLPGLTVAARPGSPPWGFDWTSKESLTLFERSHPPELLAGLVAVTDARGVAHFDRLTAGSPSGLTGSEPYELLWAFGFELVDETWSGQIDREFLMASAVEEFELRAARTTSVRVRGRCVTERGRPLAAVRVSYVHPDGRSVFSDEEGYFDLGDFVSTRFPLNLAAHPEGWCPAGEVVTLPELGEQEVVVEFIHAEAVGLRGRLLDEKGKGVAGARMMLLGALSGDQVESGDPRGDFEFPNVGEGRHELRIAAPDGRTMALFVEASQDPLEIRLPAKDAEISLVLDLVEAGDSPELPVPTSVSFTNPMGGSFKGGHDSLGAITHSPRRIQREPGLIRAEGIPPGLWMVNIQCEGFPRRALALELEAGSGEIRREVRLERAGQLSVSVTGGVEGEAVMFDFTRVLLEDPTYRDEPLQYWHLDQISGMSFEPVFNFELAPGSWWLSVNQNGRAGFAYVDVASGENPRIDVNLDSCSRIEIPMEGLGPGQTPLLDLRVGAGRQRFAPRADFDANGMFYLAPAGALEWRVYVNGDRLTGSVRELARGSGELAPGETKVLDL